MDQSQLNALIANNIPDNNTGTVTPAKVRDVLNNMNGSLVNVNTNSIFYQRFAITAGQLATCGSVPIVLLPAFGGEIFQSVFGASLKYTFVTEEYDFSSVVVKYAGKAVSTVFMNQDLNSLSTFYGNYRRESNNEYVGEDIVLTTEDGTDPTQGDGTLILKLFYSIDNIV